jgi:hypothetical protein
VHEQRYPVFVAEPTHSTPAPPFAFLRLALGDRVLDQVVLLAGLHGAEGLFLTYYLSHQDGMVHHLVYQAAAKEIRTAMPLPMLETPPTLECVDLGHASKHLKVTHPPMVCFPRIFEARMALAL